MYLVTQKTVICKAVLYLKNNTLYNPVECFPACTDCCMLKFLQNNTPDQPAYNLFCYIFQYLGDQFIKRSKALNSRAFTIFLLKLILYVSIYKHKIADHIESIFGLPKHRCIWRQSYYFFPFFIFSKHNSYMNIRLHAAAN